MTFSYLVDENTKHTTDVSLLVLRSFFSVFYLILVLQLQGKLKSYLLVGNGLRWNAVGEQKRVLTL